LSITVYTTYSGRASQVDTPDTEIKHISGVLSSQELPDATIEVNRYQTGISLQAGKAMATVKVGAREHPAVIVNEYGKGRAILLGCDVLSAFGNWKEMKYTAKRIPVTRSILENAEKMMRTAGVPLRGAVVDANGQRIPLVKTYYRRLGKATLIAIARDSSSTTRVDKQPALLPLSEKSHVYQVLFDEPGYLGFSDKAQFETSPKTQLLLAVAPYQVTGIAVAPLGVDSAQAGTTATFSVSLQTVPEGEGDAHVVCVRVIDPTGNPKKAYEKILTLKGGRGGFEVPFALNDQPGDWTVVVEDAMTRTKNECHFTLKPR